METLLQFDDAIDALYKRHDGGQDTRKGVQRASDFPDRDSIPDFDAAALMVYLDIYRGVPTENPDEFRFGPQDLLAESAFDRMLARAVGTEMDEVKKIERSEGGITYGAALDKVNALLGGKPLTGSHDAGTPLNRALAVELVAEALRTSDGSGALPYLFYVPEDTALTELLLGRRIPLRGRHPPDADRAVRALPLHHRAASPRRHAGRALRSSAGTRLVELL